jgi:hypothetical protein
MYIRRFLPCPHGFYGPLGLGAHFHNVVVDGVFAEDEASKLNFYPASELNDEVFEELQGKLRKRILAYLVRHGYLDALDADDMMGCPQSEKPLAFLRTASRGTWRLLTARRCHD